MGIYRGPGGTGDAVNDASSEARLTVEAKDAALAAQVAAELAESNASTSATNASTSATAASSSASSASTSASSASTSASNASSSASSASTSASTATTQAGIATTKASEASTSATNAASSASSASTSATNAVSAQTAAESARDATLAAYDSFDDRYLGAKSSAPSVDNDGNALVGGTLYFDTVSQSMKLYTGSAWVDAYVPGGTYLAKASNLSDLANAATARTNLGLAIGSNVQAWDADLDAIAAIAGTSGLLKKTAANTWSLDTNTYLTSAVTSVTGTSPVVSSGGTTPAISIPAANATTNGYMTSTYASKLDGIAAGATANTGTVTSIVAGTGLSGGTITTSGTVALANTAVTAGSYTNTNITVDAQGRITSASNGSAGGVTSVTGTAPVVSSGGATPAISMTAATTSVNGYLTSTDWNTFNNKQAALGFTPLNPTTSQTANTVYAAPNGSAGAPTFRAIVAADVPTLNQSTTGSAATLTTSRNIALSGDASGSASFNGSADATISATLATVNSNTGSFGSSTAIPVLTLDGKGRVTAASTATVAGGQYFGSASTKAIAYNADTIGENITITSGNNGLSAGPITISTGYTVTVNGNWVIV